MTDEQAETGHGTISVQDAAALAGVSRQAVHTWFAQGHLNPIQTGNRFGIDAAELAQFLDVRRAAAAVGIKTATLLHWVDESAAQEASFSG